MFKRLIIPLDGSRLSEAILPTAAHLAQKLQAGVTLVHVIERNAPKQVHGEPHLSEAAEAETYLEGVRARCFPPEVPVEMHVHTTAIADVARSIVDHAHEFESDLVMMCTHGRSGIKNLLFGSIAQQVVASGVPVLLVRPQESGPVPVPQEGAFLVPLDGTEIREAALPAAASLARACGRSVQLLVIVPTLDTLTGAETTSRILLPATTQEMLDIAHEDAGKYANEMLARLRAEGTPATAHVRRGDATKLITKEAQSAGADLIIMGTSARAGLDAFWSGSVAPRVSRHTHLPILLIPG
ncbi:MAG: universal stress protein [Chthoniobacteraceae bacterium]|nr:universal stress protein [Chthoniobacteraceae bacterium]